MVELVDTRDLKSRGPCVRASSNLALGTKKKLAPQIAFGYCEALFLYVKTNMKTKNLLNQRVSPVRSKLFYKFILNCLFEPWQQPIVQA